MRLKTPAGLERERTEIPPETPEIPTDKLSQVSVNPVTTANPVGYDPSAPWGHNKDGSPRDKPGRKPKDKTVELALKSRYTWGGALDGSKPNTHVKVFARPYTEEAVLTLAEIMRDEDAPPAVRVSAASQLIDRAWGKAKETLELEAPAEGIRAVLAGVSSNDLSDLLRAVRGQGRQEIDVTPTKVDALPDPGNDKAP